MLDDKDPPHSLRKIHPVTRALKQTQDQIGQLNEATTFMIAFAQRNSGDLSPLRPAIAENRQRLADATALLETAVSQLPVKHHIDSRLSDTRAALDRIGRALNELDAQLGASTTRGPTSPVAD